MSDTTRTDAIFASPNRPSPAQLKPIMQQLERELAAAVARAEFLARELSTLKLDFEDKQRRLGRKTVLEWIPVGDMLPEVPSDPCLVIANTRIYAAYRTQGPNNEQYWRDDSGRVPFVTHWCPWPTAPTL